ncbi:MAG: diadenylate cyclase [Candidatus Paceibacterota bacterium]|jgi:uncharacterized protein (TIGR00159 family)
MYVTVITFLSDLIKGTEFTFGIKETLDIIVVAFLAYLFILLLKRTHSFFIFLGVILFGAIYFAARFFDLYLTRLIFQTVFPFFVFILIVIFQRELRYFFEWLATWRILSFLKQKNTFSEVALNDSIATIMRLAETKMGALIVFTGRQSIDRFLSGGVTLGGRISVPLLLSIFDDSSPGHDGAVIINNSRIEKFGARLPLAKKFEYENLGTRHCAALGLSQRSDAFIVVVSEERGTISYAHDGTLTMVREPIELKEALQAFLHDAMPSQTKGRFYALFTRNIPEKAAAVLFALAFWFIFVVQSEAGIVNRQFAAPLEFRYVPQGYVIDDVTPKTIAITLAGENREFKLLKDENLKVLVDIADTTPGEKKIKISEEIVDYPSSFQLVTLSPKTVRYTLRKE